MSEVDPRLRLRTTFSEDADLYDKVRPRYPKELLRRFETDAELGKGCQVLEIGCGTGQLTVSLAEIGCEVVALDLGVNTVTVARRNLDSFPAVTVLQADFEEWTLPDTKFDVVVSATAFHWLNPATRVLQAAKALRSGGTLAVISTHHVAGGNEDFFREVQICYGHWCGPSDEFSLPRASDIPKNTEEFDVSGKFETTRVHRYEWEQPYSATSYCELLLTYSDHRALPRETRNGLMNCIQQLIDSKYNGQIRKRYMNQLTIMKKR